MGSSSGLSRMGTIALCVRGCCCGGPTTRLSTRKGAGSPPIDPTSSPSPAVHQLLPAGRTLIPSPQVDSTTSQVHVQGGMKLSALHLALTPHSLALSSLGSISDQTLAGALSTATHGSGVTFGNLSTSVTFLDLVLPLPGIPVVRVSEESDPELFKSALCGLGAVGVVVGVGLQCEKAFRLEEECWTIGLADFVDRWEEIAGSAEHVRCWWFPQVGEVKVSRMNRTTKVCHCLSCRWRTANLSQDLTPPPPIVKTWITETLVAKHFHALVLALTRYFPNLLPYHAHLMWALVHRPAPIEWSKVFRPVFPASSASIEGERTKLGAAMKDAMGEKESTPPLPILTKPTYRVDISNNIFNYDCGLRVLVSSSPSQLTNTPCSPQYTYEGAIPFSRTGECLLALEAWHTKELNDPKGLRSHFPVEIRFTEKDDIWLSPTYGMRGTYIGAIQYRCVSSRSASQEGS